MDFLKMMKQAKQLQEKMGSLQEEVAQIEVTGTSGGGLVTMTLSGKGDMKSLRIDPSLAKEDEIEILEDLILAAHNDAKAKAEAAMQEKTQELMGGLGLPAGMKAVLGGMRKSGHRFCAQHPGVRHMPWLIDHDDTGSIRSSIIVI